MAKEIGSTPPLSGRNAEQFLKRMNDPPSKKDKEYKLKLKQSASIRYVGFFFK